MKKISITTPCLEITKDTMRTANSILSQNAVIEKKIELQYTIVTCDSTPSSSYVAELITRGVKIINEPDNGLYDALAKGLAVSDGDVVGYLNSGDQYLPKAFDVLNEIFDLPNVEWVTGYSTICNSEGQLIAGWKPAQFDSELFTCGAYCAARHRGRPCVQQESTFWSSMLNSKIDYAVLKEFQLAGDYYLWMSFSKYSELYSAHAFLGSFEVRHKQLSDDKVKYASEISKYFSLPTNKQRLLMYIDWNLSWKLKKNLEKIIKRKIPKSIQYSVVNSRWEMI